jgi:hypothetical protein
MPKKNEKWLWRALAAAIYAAVFFVTISTLQELRGEDADADES